MSREWNEHVVDSCPCGKGQVIEKLWSNNHAFASNYSWHSAGLEINCPSCSDILEIVNHALPEAPSKTGRKVSYFVQKQEMVIINQHNNKLKEQLHEIKSLIQEILLEQGKILACTKKELIQKGQGVRGKKRQFEILGHILGITTFEHFKILAENKHIHNYISRIVKLENLVGVLQRMDEEHQANTLNTLTAKLHDFEQTKNNLEASSRQPKWIKYIVH